MAKKRGARKTTAGAKKVAGAIKVKVASPRDCKTSSFYGWVLRKHLCKDATFAGMSIRRRKVSKG